jgi:hypothetical protein
MQSQLTRRRGEASDQKLWRVCLSLTQGDRALVAARTSGGGIATRERPISICWCRRRARLRYAQASLVADLELTRAQGDRRRYDLAGVGTLRLQGLFSRSAVAEAEGSRWRFTVSGVFQPRVTARDESGAAVGEFEARTLRRGGALRWGERELMLRPASAWRERYALAEGDSELALFDGAGWGRRPVKVTVDDPGALDAGLLLFTAFVVRRIAEDAGSSAAATTSSTAATGS